MPNASNTDRVRAAVGGEDVTHTRAIIAIQGPRAREIVQPISTIAAGVGHNEVVAFEFDGAQCIAAGTGYTGEDGLECAVPVAAAPGFWEAVVGGGALPAGLGARDTLRLEAGLPLHGHELGPGITPLQAGLAWVVAFDKGSFPGRAALVAERAVGPTRRLRGVLGASRRPLHGEQVVQFNDVTCGVITSGNYSPVLERGIGFALLDSAVGLGEMVSIVTPRGTLAATVVKPPFTHLFPLAQPNPEE